MKSLESIYNSILLENQNTNNIDLKLLKSCVNNQLTSLDGAPSSVGGYFNCNNNPNLPYSELFKIVDKVKGNIYYSSYQTPEDKDKIRRDRDVKNVLKDNELGSLDV